MEEADIQAMKRIENQAETYQVLARRILTWVNCARRYLSTTELRSALAVGEEDAFPENESALEFLFSICGGLVTTSTGPYSESADALQFSRFTAYDYRLLMRRTWFPHAETEVARACIAYLSSRRFEQSFCGSYEGFEERLRRNPFFAYAA
ncbi:hypothetical protein L207DRAFT_426416, partial [Hyaloscypha variabilis F]